MTQARRAAVLGQPVGHSLSPVLHTAAYADLGLTGWTYERVEVGDAPTLRAFVESLGPEWVGLSLTMPLKRLVQPLLDTLSPTAAAVGSVNTVVLGDAGAPGSEGSGTRAGHNTDVRGIVSALGEAGVDRLAPGESVVLGGGATAASAVAALARMGDSAPTVVVRSAQRTAEVLQAAERLGVTPRLAGFDDVSTAVVGGCVAAVSTVPVSGGGAVTALVDRVGPVRGVLLDVVYEPWPTEVATAWERAGGAVVGGFVMLLHQAVEQVRLFTGRVPNPEVMRAAGLRVLAGRG
jgi:shikimate dehydrogenase